MAAFKDLILKNIYKIHFLKYTGTDIANNWAKAMHNLYDKALHHCSKLKENKVFSCLARGCRSQQSDC